MTEKNFINFHVLISHSPSCLNRDDMNMQKTAIFGGHRRVRISSQSQKYSFRNSTYYKEHLGTPSIRTRELGKLLSLLADKHEIILPREIIEKAIEFWADARSLESFDHSEIAVAPWIQEEIQSLGELLLENEKLLGLCDSFISITGNSEQDKKKKRSIVNKAVNLLKKEEKWNLVLDASANAIDVVLSGRMATSGLMTSIDGAMSIAHSITTHAIDSDIDWFSAVDDLIDQGSGHLNSQEFSAGVFYRYASLNIPQLQKNLGGATREKALEIARHVLHLMATVVPTAKNQSTAPFNLADYAMVSFSDIPVSLANAFEQPIKEKGGYLAPSIEALKDYWRQVHKGHGLDERVAAFQLGGSEGEPKTFDSLLVLEEWVEKGGEE